MPVLFVISGGWKDLFDVVKRRRAIAADQRDAVRVSVSRGKAAVDVSPADFCNSLR